MILRGSYTEESFLVAVNQRITGSSAPPDREYEAGPLVFGAGYWKGFPVYDGDQLVGLYLSSTTATADQVATVEKALAILCGFDYEED